MMRAEQAQREATPARDRFAAEVREYLLRSPRQLPSKYFYDALGSALFEAICRLPWYRIARAEERLLAEAPPPPAETTVPPHTATEATPVWRLEPVRCAARSCLVWTTTTDTRSRRTFRSLDGLVAPVGVPLKMGSVRDPSHDGPLFVRTLRPPSASRQAWI